MEALTPQNAMTLPNRNHFAEIAERFSVAHVLTHPRFFLSTPLLPEERIQNRDSRRHLQSEIIISRPQIYLNRRTNDRNALSELRRQNIIYLVRLAPLMRQNGQGVWELTSTGNFFATLRVPNVDLNKYHGKVACKFGFTTQPVGDRFHDLIPHLRRQGFPAEEMRPFYAIYITGLPPDPALLHRIESGVRNLFGKHGLRLRQHAEGVQHADNRSMLSEMFEMVYTDWQCDTAYTLLSDFVERLNAARMWAEELVRVIDANRERHIEDQENYLRGEYERTEILRDLTVLESRLRRVRVNTPKLNVRHLLFTMLEYAAATALGPTQHP